MIQFRRHLHGWQIRDGDTNNLCHAFHQAKSAAQIRSVLSESHDPQIHLTFMRIVLIESHFTNQTKQPIRMGSQNRFFKGSFVSLHLIKVREHPDSDSRLNPRIENNSPWAGLTCGISLTSPRGARGHFRFNNHSGGSIGLRPAKPSSGRCQ